MKPVQARVGRHPGLARLTRNWSERAAGGVAGLVGGAAYLLAQMAFASRSGTHDAIAPLQRIAAILMGPGAAPPGDTPGVEAAMGLLIHFPFALVCGFVIARLVRGCDVAAAALRGGIAGLLLFVLAFYVIAPAAFPWFIAVRNAATAFDHVMFGVIVGALASLLRRPA
jgi:hypothetical protein